MPTIVDDSELSPVSGNLVDDTELTPLPHPVLGKSSEELAVLPNFDPVEYTAQNIGELSLAEQAKLAKAAQLKIQNAGMFDTAKQTVAGVGHVLADLPATIGDIAKTGLQLAAAGSSPTGAAPSEEVRALAAGAAGTTAAALDTTASNYLSMGKDVLKLVGKTPLSVLPGVGTAAALLNPFSPEKVPSIGDIATAALGANALTDPAKMSESDFSKYFLNKVAARQSALEATKGSGPAAELSGLDVESLAKDGISLNPEVIAHVSLATDPINFIPFGQGFAVASKSGKVLATAATKPLIERAMSAIGGYVERQGVKMVERGEKSSRTAATAAGAAIGALTGTSPVTGAVAGVLVPPAMKLGGWAMEKSGQGLAALPKTVVGKAAGDVITSAASGVWHAINPLDNPVALLPLTAAAGADTPEERAGLLAGPIGFGLAGGALGGAAKGAKRMAQAGTEVALRSLWEPIQRTETPATPIGADSVLDAAHEAADKALRQSDPNSANAVNWIRQKVHQMTGAEVYLLDPETFSKKVSEAMSAPAGTTFNAPGFFHEAKNGVPRVYLNRAASALGHEVGHVLFNLMPEAEKTAFLKDLTDAFSPEQIKAFGDYYNSLLSAGEGTKGTTIAPELVFEEMAAEVLTRVVNSEGFGESSLPFTRRAIEFVTNASEKLGLYNPTLGGRDASILGLGTPANATSRGAKFARGKATGEVTPPPIPPSEPPASGAASPGTPSSGSGAASVVPPPLPPTPAATSPLPPSPAGRNLRVTAAQQAAADVRKKIVNADQAEAAVAANPTIYSPKTAQVFADLNQAMQRPQGEVAPVSIEYNSVKAGAGATDAKARKIEQDIAYAIENSGIPADLRAAVEKTTIPYRWTVRNENVNLNAMSVDKVLANAVKVVEQAVGKAEDLVPYDNAGGKLSESGWRQFVSDLTVYTRNQANGYGGDGSRITVPADYRGTLPEVNQTYRPVALPKENADFLNVTMALPPPITAKTPKGFGGVSPEQFPNVQAAKLAEANTRPVVRPAPTATLGKEIYTQQGANTPITETNPLRAKFADRGLDFTGRNLFQVTEELNLQDIKSVVSRPESQFRAPDTNLTRAGFMPELAEDRKSGKAFKNFFSDVTKGAEKYRPQAPWNSLISLDQQDSFLREYDQHTGNFDNHIATSIPGYKDVQVRNGDAVAKVYGESGAEVLDIAGSEGSWAKTITALTDGTVRTTVLDPNPDMAAFFKTKSEVPGSDFVPEAFQYGFEDNGVVVPAYNPEKRFDVVHEGMGFQFISNERASQLAEVKRLMKPDGVFITEEKVLTSPEVWKQNEAKKDREYKNKFYSDEKLAAKQAVVKFQQDPNEAKAVGMVDNMVSDVDFEQQLQSTFKHVAQTWDSGNFKGYAASDDPVALRRMVAAIGDTNTDFSTVKTPRAFMPAATEAGKALEARGMVVRPIEESKFRTGQFGIEARKGSKEVARVTAYQTSPTDASAGLSRTDPKFRRQGVMDALYRELGAQMQEAGIQNFDGVVINPEAIVPLREKVFGAATRLDPIPNDRGMFIRSKVDPKAKFMPSMEEYEARRAARKAAPQTVDEAIKQSDRPEAGEAQFRLAKPLPDSVGNEDLRLVHYSGRGGLTQLDPKKMGSANATATDLRALPKTYFFEEGSKSGADKPITGGVPYGARVHGSSIYDLVAGSDSLGWLDNPNREAADKTLIAAGYSGIRVKTAGRDVVAMFKPTYVVELGPKGKPSATVTVPKGAPAFMPKKQLDEAYAKADREANDVRLRELVDEAARRAGYPTDPLAHGTTHKFTVFSMDRANPENDFGKGHYFSSSIDDVTANYESAMGPDLRNRIERRAEQLESSEGIDRNLAIEQAQEELVGPTERVVKAYVKLEKPAVVGTKKGTRLDSVFDEDTGDVTGPAVDFIDELVAAAERYDETKPEELRGELMSRLMDEGGDILLGDLLKVAKESEGLQYAADPNTGDIVVGQVLREAIEAAGFDGIVDHGVSKKFRNMSGLYEDTRHVIAFRPEQIKSADLRTRDDSGRLIPLSERFDSKNPDTRFMPAAETVDGVVRAPEDAETFRISKTDILGFLPASDKVKLEDYADRKIIALAADRMGIGEMSVGPTSSKRELSVLGQGGRGFMNIFNGGGWAFSDQTTADRFLSRLKKDADADGMAIVGITVQSPINHLKNQTGQLAYVEAMQAAIDSKTITQRAADSQVAAMSSAIVASTAKSIKASAREKFRQIQSLEDLKNAVQSKGLNFADMEPLLNQMQRKKLPITAKELKEAGISPADIARDLADPELADVPFGSVVALLGVKVGQSPEQTGFHYSYPWTIHGEAIGYLDKFHNIADLSTERRIRNKAGKVTAQPLQTVMPVLDNIVNTLKTKPGIPSDPSMRFLPSSLTARDINAIAAEVGGGQVSGGAKAFGAFMRSMRDKGITLRDVVKSYGITLSSIHRKELPVATIQKNWPDAPFPAGTKVRPEDAFAQLLGTSEGQQYLDAAEGGVFDEAAADVLVQKFRSFGFHNTLKKQMQTAVEQFYPKAQEIIDAVNTMPTDTFIDYVKNNVKGVSYGKVGFWSGQLGRGDVPTFDSRQGKLVYGKEVTVTKKVLLEQKDRLTQLGIEVPAEFKDFAQTLLHHEVWDRLNQSDTEHGPIKEAMLRFMPEEGTGGMPVSEGATPEPTRLGTVQPRSSTDREKTLIVRRK